MNCIKLRMKLRIPKYISSEVMSNISDEMYFGISLMYYSLLFTFITFTQLINDHMITPPRRLCRSTRGPSSSDSAGYCPAAREAQVSRW